MVTRKKTSVLGTLMRFCNLYNWQSHSIIVCIEFSRGHENNHKYLKRKLKFNMPPTLTISLIFLIILLQFSEIKKIRMLLQGRFSHDVSLSLISTHVYIRLEKCMKSWKQSEIYEFKWCDSSNEVIPLKCPAVNSSKMYRLGLLRTLTLPPATSPSAAAALAPVVAASIGEWRMVEWLHGGVSISRNP